MYYTVSLMMLLWGYAMLGRYFIITQCSVPSGE